ncbi:MAG TPA: hypothetical protein VFS21_22580 [Roseiflexaceae bacterium]|nr:hypothetical protein [Roseiflexaceae bacterium]
MQVVFVLLAGTYVSERLIYHAVVGFGGMVSTLVIGATLMGLCLLIERGVGWLRWPVAVFFVLSGLGVPSGLDKLVGAGPALFLTMLLLIGHLVSALALCFAPGIGLFLHRQRELHRAAKAPG